MVAGGAVTLAALGITSGRAQPPGVTATEVKLGAFNAMSGPVAGIGIPVAHGAQAFYNACNDGLFPLLSKPYGRKINFINLDDGFVPARTVAVVKQLVEEEKVFAIVNSLGTGPHAAVLEYLVKNAVPVVSPHANAVFLSCPPKKNYFALQPNNIAFGTVLAKYAVEKLRAKSIGILYVDDLFGRELRDAVLAELKRQKVEPVISLPHAGAETAFGSFVLRLRDAKPDAVIMLTYLVPSASILKEAEAIGFKTQWLATNVQTDLTLFKLAGVSAVEGMIATGFMLDPNTPTHPAAIQLRTIFKQYEATLPGLKIPSGFNGIAYVGAQLVMQGILDAGRDLTREGFIAALERLKNFSAGGLIPAISYTATDRFGVKSLFMIQAKGGTFEFLEEIKADFACP